MEKRFLGITVLGDYIVSEGCEAILENLQRVGANAVACNPTVTVQAPDGHGSFQPPNDAGTSPRLFDRPLWGRHSLWVRSGPSYVPDPNFYKESAYQHRRVNELTKEYGHLIDEFVSAASGIGLSVYFQIGAAQPSGLRDEDRPRLPDGSIPIRMADVASLASPAVRAYNAAYLKDLVNHYPLVSGFRIDWPEYPCYMVGEGFQDFSIHVQHWAEEHGYAWEAILRDVGSLWDHLHGGLKTADLRGWEPLSSECMLSPALTDHHPAVRDWLKMKADLSYEIVAHWRRSLDEVGRSDMELSANAFMSPFSNLTGMNYERVATQCGSISAKLYTMHWSQMVEFWGRQLCESNPELAESDVVGALIQLFDLEEPGQGTLLSDYGYPMPDEPHPIGAGPQSRQIESFVSRVRDGSVACQAYALVHGYGPADDFRRRFEIAVDSPVDGVWINRYGYLSDEKLEIIRDTWH